MEININTDGKKKEVKGENGEREFARVLKNTFEH